MTIINTRSVWTNPYHFLAFGFGSGLSKWFPGTCGTLVAIPFYLLMQHLPWPLYLAILVVAFGAGVWFCNEAEKMIGIPDYSGIVWDEMVGFWCTMFWVPTGWAWILAGFILFRLFDILKPWPISWFNNHVHGGFGIMLDDVIAALVACVLLQVGRVMF
jgi:phosphatidylglycerophosphatase A